MSFHWRCKSQAVSDVLLPGHGRKDQGTGDGAWGEEATYTGVPGIPDLVGEGIKGPVSQSISQGFFVGHDAGGMNAGCNAQLESEGTGEDGGQEDSIAANEGAK